MAEDFDVEAMLEAPYQKNNVSAGGAGRGRVRSSISDNDDHEDDERAYAANGTRSSNGTKKRSHRSRSRSGSRSNKHRRSKERDRGDRERERDKDRNRDKDKEKEKDREREQRDQRYRDDKRSSNRSRNDRPSDSDKRGGSRGRSDREKERERDRGDRSSRDKRRRSRSIEQRKRQSPVRERRRSHSRSRDTNSRRRTSYSPRPYGGRGRGGGGRSPANGFGDRTPPTELSPEERDARTVFCIQLSQRVRARDLEEFFSSVGKVRDVRLITCNKTKRFKGIAYIEFEDPESVALALGLSGQRLLGVPIMVQHTQAEKNRLQNAPPPFQPKPHTGPMRLYVGSLHFNITEDMLRGIFEPFGKIDNIQLVMDTETGRSKGYGFITYHNADDAKKALEQLNGFELAGRPMKVGNVTERLDMNTSSLDTDEMDRSGIDLGATGRLQLMFKLAEGAGLAVPQAAANALLATAPQPAPIQQQQQAPSIATQCFVLSNMFDPRTETNPTWDTDIREDVLEECAKHGGVLHIHVDTVAATGTVYVKCPSTTTAVLAVNSLHGRWFAGRVITAAYVPLSNYHAMFPDSHGAADLISSTRKMTDD
ncbi:CG11266 [Drosophila busckii]|uniref:CG11266 n=1 Tax=Drosophila busckii TaxID=30019 RepID=A0A0M4EN29_DROBS|nr:RNA-binding protein 39 isoform X1 [Drosophila busckii]XP_017855215.1 RNA-binding protein 39 isoform X1 [Drosophila busckii]ALC38012.1 CG11266 [Drosophila busckii]